MKYHTLPRSLGALRSSLEALNLPKKMGTAIKQEKALVDISRDGTSYLSLAFCVTTLGSKVGQGGMTVAVSCMV